MSFIWCVERFWSRSWEYVNTHGQTDVISRQCEHQARWRDICCFWYEWRSWGEGNPDLVGDNLVLETESEENSGRRQRKLTKKGKEYKILYKIQRLFNQLMRKCCVIDDLLYPKDHFVTAKEELQLSDGLFCCVKNIIVCLMLKILAFKSLTLSLKILMQGFLLSNTKLETGIKKMKKENKWDQNPADIASHHQ